MDAEYLRRTVGDCLVHCLAEVAEKQPADPIEYIAHWLHKHVANLELKEQNAADVIELERQRVEYAALQEALEQQRLEQERINQEEIDKAKAAEATEAAAAAAAAALTTLTEHEEQQEQNEEDVEAEEEEAPMAILEEEEEEEDEVPQEFKPPTDEDTT